MRQADPRRASADDQTRILEMVRDGRISVEEADRLLRALEPPEGRAAPDRAKILRVRVSGRRGERVNVAIPLELADAVLRLLPRRVRMTFDGRDLDLAAIVADLRDSNARGTIVDFQDPHGDHIEIIAE